MNCRYPSVPRQASFGALSGVTELPPTVGEPTTGFARSNGVAPTTRRNPVHETILRESSIAAQSSGLHTNPRRVR